MCIRAPAPPFSLLGSGVVLARRVCPAGRAFLRRLWLCVPLLDLILLLFFFFFGRRGRIYFMEMDLSVVFEIFIDESSL